MATINVRRDVQDSFYRYKMPKLVARVEGKGNGIKTLVVNVSDVARSLARPPSYPTKYFGCELGAQVKCEDSTDRYIVNGAHEPGKLQDLLDGFITKFVLCNECQNPETIIKITSDQVVLKDCKACGKKTDVDMRHKLVAYILKNPPPNAIEKKSKKEKKRKSKAEGDDILDEQSDDDFMTQKIQAEAAEANIAGATSALESWSVDTSADAVARRMKDAGVDEIESRMDRLMQKDDGDADSAASPAIRGKAGGNDEDEDNEGGADSLEVLATFLESDRATSDAQILAKMEETSAKDYKIMATLGESLFTDNILNELEKRSELLETKLEGNQKAQRGFLGGLERLIGVRHPDTLLGKLNAVFVKLYELELVEEEVFKEWGAKASKKYVEKDVSKELRKRAAKFLEWLENAESESD